PLRSLASQGDLSPLLSALDSGSCGSGGGPVITESKHGSTSGTAQAGRANRSWGHRRFLYSATPRSAMALRVLLKKSYSQLAGSFSGASRLELHRCAHGSRHRRPASLTPEEGGVASLSNALSGGLHPRLAIPNNNGLHGFTARYLNTSPCPRELVTRSCSRTGVNSVNINHIMKSASVRPATGAGRTFSSKTTTSDEPSIESQIKAN
uniref:Uncharacterized protein n=1 Tax=Aegilops tauschii subsp. strangulata TaxID=200361 RepID=A0A453SG42_AEGTS